jgi:hypothetical protein
MLLPLHFSFPDEGYAYRKFCGLFFALNVVLQKIFFQETDRSNAAFKVFSP